MPNIAELIYKFTSVADNKALAQYTTIDTQTVYTMICHNIHQISKLCNVVRRVHMKNTASNALSAVQISRMYTLLTAPHNGTY